jgi:hypothetical protein
MVGASAFGELSSVGFSDASGVGAVASTAGSGVVAFVGGSVLPFPCVFVLHAENNIAHITNANSRGKNLGLFPVFFMVFSSLFLSPQNSKLRFFCLNNCFLRFD